jgi:predicted acetyltransferase
MEIIAAAREQEPILANLLELYAHDFSEFHHLQLGKDGRFGYSQLPLYWTDPGRHPFLVRIDEELAGLVLVKTGSELTGNETVWDIAEFFVVRGHRRRGLGTEIARELWNRFPGLWEVRAMHSNRPARQFWEHAISAFLGETIQSVQFDKGGECWHLFSFESKRA